MNDRRGITLLEIVLALALAAIAISLLAQLLSLGNRSAAAARDQSKAQLIAQSIMAEYTSGVSPPQASSGTWELDPTWSYEVTVGIGPTETINVITVTVNQGVEVNPATFTLTQWLAIPPVPEEELTGTGGAAL